MVSGLSLFGLYFKDFILVSRSSLLQHSMIDVYVLGVDHAHYPLIVMSHLLAEHLLGSVLERLW